MFFFLPYRVNRRFKKIPVVTIGLIVTNVLVYFLTASNIQNVAKGYGFIPNVDGIYTWFTGMFLHADLFSHLGWNMYFLWLFGSSLEDAIGWRKYSILYLASGLVSSLAHAGIIAIFLPELHSMPLIGASGAVAGVMGVFAVRFYKNEISIAYFMWILVFVRWGVFELTSVAGLSLWFARELFSGLIQLGGLPSAVANWAHIGGFAFGAVIAYVFGFVKEADTEYLTDEATTYARAGIHDVASATYDKLLQTNPDNPEIYLEKARSGIFANDVNREQAALDFRKAIELFIRGGRKEEALNAYREWMMAYPDVELDAKTLLILGSLSEGHQDYEMAVRTYLDLADCYPTAWETEKALFRLAHVYLKMGKSQDATATWKSFSERYPNSEWLPFADTTFLSVV